MSPERPIPHNIHIEKVHRPFEWELRARVDSLASLKRPEVPQSVLVNEFGHPLPPVSKRRDRRTENLRGYVTKEIECFTNGEVERLSTITELKEIFGYRQQDHVSRALNRVGLRQVRQETMKRAVEEAKARGTSVSLPRGSERVRALIDYAREERALFEAGLIDTLSTQEELAVLFDYEGYGNINKYLKRAGIKAARNEVQRRKEAQQLTPSRELAWMIGTLSTGGFVRNEPTHTREQGQISVNSSLEDPTLDTFKALGEQLFGTNAHDELQRNGQKREVKFYAAHIAKQLGDLSSSQWGNTVRETHNWIREKPEYIWAFLEGFFNRSGNFNRKGLDKKGTERPKYLEFRTSFIVNANLLAELLTIVGVQAPKIAVSNTSAHKDGIKGIAIYNAQDIQLIARNIHSTVPEKEAKLNQYRAVDVPDYKSHPTDEDLIQEWQRLTLILGHAPNSNDLKKFYEQGDTKYHRSAYEYHFGDGKFTPAKGKLESIIFERMQG